MTTAIVEYSKTDAALADLAQRYKGVVFDVTAREGMHTAVKGRAELRTYRVALEKTRKEIKAPALERCQLIDAEARRITAELAALEDPIDSQIKKEEQRKEDERMAVVRAEDARIAAEQQALKDAEEKRMAEERAEIARRQAELDRAERERLEADKQARLKIEADERAARQRIEEEQRTARLIQEEEERKARAAREKADRAARLAREAEEAKARKAIEEEDARLKAERDRIESEKREQLRLANELNDGYEMLATFVRRFGKRVEFRAVAAAIGPYLRKVA